MASEDPVDSENSIDHHIGFVICDNLEPFVENGEFTAIAAAKCIDTGEPKCAAVSNTYTVEQTDYDSGWWPIE